MQRLFFPNLALHSVLSLESCLSLDFCVGLHLPLVIYTTCLNWWTGLNRQRCRSRRWSSSAEVVFNNTILKLTGCFYSTLTSYMSKIKGILSSQFMTPLSKGVLTLAHPVFITVISSWTVRAAETWWGQNLRGQTGSTGVRTIATAVLTRSVTFWRT